MLHVGEMDDTFNTSTQVALGPIDQLLLTIHILSLHRWSVSNMHYADVKSSSGSGLRALCIERIFLGSFLKFGSHVELVCLASFISKGKLVQLVIVLERFKGGISGDCRVVDSL